MLGSVLPKLQSFVIFSIAHFCFYILNNILSHFAFLSLSFKGEIYMSIASGNPSFPSHK